MRWKTPSLSFAAIVLSCILTATPQSNAQEPAKVGTGEVKDAPKASPKPKVAVFRLNGAVTETSPDSTFSLSTTTGVALRDLIQRMKKAATDDQVKAVVILADGASVGNAQIEEIRQAMARLRKAGKQVYAHSDSLDMAGYVLLSGASHLSMVPTSDLWLTGLYGESPYLRGLLDKIGVRPDFLTCGEYKSAAEMYLREGPSPEAEAMQNWLLDSMFETHLGLIAEGRGREVAKARSWVDGGPYTAEKACEAGLIDAVEHRQDFQARIAKQVGEEVVFDRQYGKKITPKPDFSSPFALFKILGEMMSETPKKGAGKPSIGIVYVDGPIEIGAGPTSPFNTGSATSTEIRKALDDAAADDSIKAVVLRVNSPGGSAVASEIILDATRRVKAKKPFVVSMGDVAGSGGYYVACASDLIYADASTITASIGVVGGKMALNGLWDKLGVSFKSYKRGENAGLLGSGEPFTPAEREKMQTWMDDIYGVFKSHVTAARGDRLKKPLDEMAGGRVYTGKQALELGLVDRIGTLDDAITHVAGKAALEDYEIREVPAPKNFLEKLLEEASDEGDGRKGLDTAIGTMIGARSVSLLDLAMPHLRGLDPKRVDLVRMALARLQLLHQEGVIVMMPELGIGR